MLIGLVGKPSCGKSSFFSAATMIGVEIAAYPFTTIEPNKGMGFVRVECACRDFNVKCSPRTGFCRNGTRFVPVELMDVAGLVPDAHLGKGRGNAFLDDLRQADVLIHVVDSSGSTNEKGEPTEQHDPCKDVEFLEKEIDQWFFGVLKKNWAKISRTPTGSKAKTLELLKENLSGLGVKESQIELALKSGGLLEKSFSEWSGGELFGFARALRAESKPIVVAANKADLPSAPENIERMEKKFPHTKTVACSAASELALKKASKEGFAEYLAGDGSFAVKKELSENQEKGLEIIKKKVLEKYGSTGIQKTLETAVFELLEMVAVFPVSNNKLSDSDGKVLPDCFLVPKTCTVLEFAFKLHTDIGKGFIRAVDMHKKTVVGKEHVLKNRDVVEIVFKKK